MRPLRRTAPPEWRRWSGQAAGAAVGVVERERSGDDAPGPRPGGLQAAAANLQASIDGRKTLKATAVGATAGTAKAVATVKAALKVLDSLVVPALADNATLLAQWKNAKKINKKTRVATASTVVPTPTPAEQSAVVPIAADAAGQPVHHPLQEAA